MGLPPPPSAQSASVTKKARSTLPPPPKPTRNPVEVVKFDPSNYGIQKRSSKEPKDTSTKEIFISDDKNKTEFDRTEDSFDKDVSDIYKMLSSIEDFSIVLLMM